jgi:hypothetical protein
MRSSPVANPSSGTPSSGTPGATSNGKPVE